jgi:hypothetical protein
MSRSYRRRADNVYARLYKKHLLGGAKRSSRSSGSLHETTTTLLVGSCFVGEPIGKGRARRRRQTGGPCVQRSQLGASTVASTCAQRCADPTAAQVSAPIASPPSEPSRRWAAERREPSPPRPCWIRLGWLSPDPGAGRSAWVRGEAAQPRASAVIMWKPSETWTAPSQVNLLLQIRCMFRIDGVGCPLNFIRFSEAFFLGKNAALRISTGDVPSCCM